MIYYIQTAHNVEGSKKNVFLVKVRYSTSQKTFAKHGLSKIPAIAYFGSHNGRTPSKYNGKIDDNDQYPVENGFTAEEIASFVEKKTGVHLEILRSALPKILFLIVLMLIGFTILKPILNNLENLKALREYTSLWRTFSIVCYISSNVTIFTKFTFFWFIHSTFF